MLIKILVVASTYLIHLGGQYWNMTHALKFDLGEYRLFVIGVIVYFMVTHGFDSKYNSPLGEYPRASSRGGININNNIGGATNDMARIPSDGSGSR